MSFGTGLETGLALEPRSSPSHIRFPPPATAMRTPPIAPIQKRAAICASLALWLCLCAGCAGVPNGGASLRRTPTEKMMWSTYPLVSKSALGTCFMVARKGTPDGVVVLTSVHFLKTTGKGSLFLPLRFRPRSGELLDGVLELKPQRQHGDFYVRHPQCDIAAFDLPLPAGMVGFLALPFDESALRSGGAPPGPGEEVLFAGFPEVFPGTGGVFPVLRGGRVASYPAGPLRAVGKFLINADVYPGDSGAPVFAARTHGRPRLLGMVTSRVGTSEKQSLPLALAVEASAISETMQLLTERRRGEPEKFQAAARSRR